MGSIEEARSNQRIGWCCVDRLNRHDKPGMYLEPGQIVTMPLRDLAPSFVTKCRERFHARGPQRGNVGGEHGGHTEHDE
jgi:hypothetical protein